LFLWLIEPSTQQAHNASSCGEQDDLAKQTYRIIQSVSAVASFSQQRLLIMGKWVGLLFW
jgi:hypothetical protein